MNLKERANIVRAMDTLARSINDEGIMMDWLAVGVADGDIDGSETDESLEYYCEDDILPELMDTFLCLMEAAKKDGGLYVDGVVSQADLKEE